MEDKPIHICLRVGKADIEESESYCEKIKDFIWWSYHTKYEDSKNPISDSKIYLLNENIKKFNCNFVYFIADNGAYEKKARLLGLESNETKNDFHVPKGWEGKSELWVKCNGFMDSNLEELKSLVFESDKKKPYLNLDKRRKLYPFWSTRAVNLVIEYKTFKEISTAAEENIIDALFKKAIDELGLETVQYVDDCLLKMKQIAEDKGKRLPLGWERLAREKINEWATDKPADDK
ncbi:MAG: hypothetical protein OIN86_10275 [Candidatus Methanoperedens sp.]|nr:hypothetical protein [Candidatus Methanoperedens sp.]CAG0971184.1 hypothetical protein METP1_01251 [Methanosarcinales archaeon]